jgi:predicted ATPase
MPESLRQMIEQRLERVSPAERAILEVASVAGVEFSAATVAAGVETTVEAVEEQCAELARRESFLQARGTADWPDGTVATRYGFLHALYQEVLYERLPAGRRQRLHQRIGEREEAAYGEQAREIAAELALHFERGREYRKAVQYLQQAGENAVRRSAHQEAIALLTKGLELLKTLLDTPERAQQELMLQAALGQPLIATKGFAAPEVEQTYTRAVELCEQVGETPQLFPMLFGLWLFYLTRVDMQTARERAEQLLRLAHSAHEPALLLEAHRAVGSSLYWLGEFASAQAHLEQALTLYNSQQHRSHAFRYGQDPGVACCTYAARNLWYLGYPDQALQRSSEALALAQESSNPFDLAHALVFAVDLHKLRREWQVAREQAEAVITLSTEQGFPMWLALGMMERGGALAEQGQVEEGIAQMRQGLAAYRAIGAERMTSILPFLAIAYAKVGWVEEGLSVVAEALDLQRTGERRGEAELYRVKGELTLQKLSVASSQLSVINPQPLTPNPYAEAEACFLRAIEIARKQQARSLELRAVMSLSRLWQQQGKKDEARQMLADIYNWFTEGFDTKDLQEAKALLDSLGSSVKKSSGFNVAESPILSS